MIKRGPALLALCFCGAPAFADGGLVDAFVNCTADEIVTLALRTQCNGDRWVLYPPACRVEFEALVSSQGEAAVNRARAAGEAVAAQELQDLAEMDACEAFEIKAQNSQASDAAICIGQHSVALLMAARCDYPMGEMLKGPQCVQDHFSAYLDDKPAFDRRSKQSSAWKLDYLASNDIAFPLEGQALCELAQAEIANETVIGAILGLAK